MMVKMCIRIMICRDERDEGSGVPEVKVVVDQEEERKWGKMILIEVSNAPWIFYCLEVCADGKVLRIGRNVCQPGGLMVHGLGDANVSSKSTCINFAAVLPLHSSSHSLQTHNYSPLQQTLSSL